MQYVVNDLVPYSDIASSNPLTDLFVGGWVETVETAEELAFAAREMKSKKTHIWLKGW